MRVTKQNLLIKRQIRKEINRYLKKINTVQMQKTNTQYEGNFLPSATPVDNVLEELIVPILSLLTKRRIISGGMPTKISSGLKLFIHPMVVGFGEDNIFKVDSKEIDLNYYTEDRWIYVYVDSDGEFVINKYSPTVGSNVDRIPICRIWIEHDATDYNLSLLRDLRPVGVASANLNHVLRQTFINLMQSIPAVLTSTISVNPYNESGNPNLMIYVQADNNNAVFANLTPLPEEKVVIPKPESGSKDYLVIAQATIDNTSPDDLKFAYVVKEITESLATYDIPICLVENVNSGTLEITSDMIKVLGFQKLQKDYYLLNYSFEDNNHSVLSFRDSPNCHPAISISFTPPSGSTLTSDNVQGALEEIDAKTEGYIKGEYDSILKMFLLEN